MFFPSFWMCWNEAYLEEELLQTPSIQQDQTGCDMPDDNDR
jgi:hypothetical protein